MTVIDREYYENRIKELEQAIIEANYWLYNREGYDLLDSFGYPGIIVAHSIYYKVIGELINDK